MGMCYLGGEGVEKDVKKAMFWIQEGAKTNHDRSLTFLGHTYLYGNFGLAKDVQQGMSLIRKAAEQNYPDACVILGNCYVSGIHVQKDVKTGIDFLILALLQGEDQPKQMLELLYKMSDTNRTIALERFQYYSKQGNSQADIF